MKKLWIIALTAILGLTLTSCGTNYGWSNGNINTNTSTNTSINNNASTNNDNINKIDISTPSGPVSNAAKENTQNELDEVIGDIQMQ